MHSQAARAATVTWGFMTPCCACV